MLPRIFKWVCPAGIWMCDLKLRGWAVDIDLKLITVKGNYYLSQGGGNTEGKTIKTLVNGSISGTAEGIHKGDWEERPESKGQECGALHRQEEKESKRSQERKRAEGRGVKSSLHSAPN